MKNSSALRESVQYIREHVKQQPSVAVILGSGLGEFAESLGEGVSLPTSQVPHYPQSSVEGHKGRLVFGRIAGSSVLAFQGRVHFYESGDLSSVLYPVRIANALGVRTLIVTNAAGGINRTLTPGDLMLITDQMNLTFERLAIEDNPDYRVSVLYSPRLIEIAEAAAASLGIVVRKGVYVGLKGPSYETAAEIEMLSRIGADAVGMSTVFEVSLAARYGIEVLGISCITNLSTGITASKLNHAEVTEVGNRVKDKFSRLLRATIAQLA